MSTKTSKVVQAFAFRSSNGKTLYQTLEYDTGATSCDCPGWTKRVASDGSRSCKHTRWVAMGLGETQAETSIKHYEHGGAMFSGKMPAKQPKAKEQQSTRPAVRAFNFDE